MPLGQNTHLPEHYDTASHLSNRTTPSSEGESRTAGGTRKRVPVACERCRKRKIKCSGNEGENSSCINCKNAGYADNCRFLRVSSMETAPLALRAWQQPNHRYSPYPHLHHRMTYIPMTPRYNPPTPMQYPTVPSSVEYGSYAGSAQNIDWTRASYVAQYPTYGEEEETSPYLSQPPPYILPHTDPMASRNGYYVNPNGVRPQPGAMWSDQQQTPIQQNTNLPTTTYAQSTEAPLPFQSTGVASNLPSDRTLPDPIRAPNYLAAAQPTMDNLTIPNQSQRNSNGWSISASTSTTNMTSQVEIGAGRAQASEQRNTPYRLQELAYGHLALNEALSSTPLSEGLPTGIVEPQPSAPGSTTEDHHSQRPSQRILSQDNLRSASEAPSVSYGYTSAITGCTSQLRGTSGQVSAGLLYCSTQPTVSQRESGSEDCSPDCASCPTDSTRSSITSMSNASSGY
ncbi:uncharacterized protein A1O9_07285 [Exophiala aquamarina CBS 119918]|uniref:Zn(2)-C6 fungal-type domain-containing protein n=1 Tax=Exophiala aquamarina CBS 119918 TaxID=1182545 RepID=A0A072PNI6_9EURO|nr:uncharacterized protein A1O9_07285 [Exophiala aquamarina CBS 119918]KEF57095.1 hypothetical protein A1O9_07285 [Exophiala aquamarina CBS 119918]